MRPSFLLSGLALLLLGCASPPPASDPGEDGYALLVEALTQFEAMDIRGREPRIQQIDRYRRHGGELEPEGRDLLETCKPLLDLVVRAGEAPRWGGPRAATSSMEEFHPTHLQILTATRVAEARAVEFLLAGHPQDAAAFLFAWARTSYRLAESGLPTEFLFHVSVRRITLPLHVRTIEETSAADLKAMRDHGRSLLDRLLPASTWARGEWSQMQNFVPRVVAEMWSDPDYQAAHQDWVARLQAAGVDKEIVRTAADGELLSPLQWAPLFLTILEPAYLDGIGLADHGTTDELLQRIEAFDIIGGLADAIDAGHEIDEAIQKWPAWMEASSGDDFELEEALAAHTRIGEDFARRFAATFRPSQADIALRHRELLAMERLLLIRIAARQFAAREGREPESLGELLEAGLVDRDLATDPITRERFRSTHVNGRFHAYSVGRNLEDNGGRLWDAERGLLDIILLPWPEHIPPQQER